MSRHPGPATPPRLSPLPSSRPPPALPAPAEGVALRLHLSSSSPHLQSRFTCSGQNTVPLAQWLARCDAGYRASGEIMANVAHNLPPVVHTDRAVLPLLPAPSSPPGSPRVILAVRLRGNRDEVV